MDGPLLRFIKVNDFWKQETLVDKLNWSWKSLFILTLACPETEAAICSTMKLRINSFISIQMRSIFWGPTTNAKMNQEGWTDAFGGRFLPR